MVLIANYSDALHSWPSTRQPWVKAHSLPLLPSFTSQEWTQDSARQPFAYEQSERSCVKRPRLYGVDHSSQVFEEQNFFQQDFKTQGYGHNYGNYSDTWKDRSRSHKDLVESIPSGSNTASDTPVSPALLATKVLAIFREELAMFREHHADMVIARLDRQKTMAAVLGQLREYLLVEMKQYEEVPYQGDDWRTRIKSLVEQNLGPGTLHIGTLVQHAKARKVHLSPQAGQFNPQKIRDHDSLRRFTIPRFEAGVLSPVEEADLKRISKASSGVSRMVARTIGGLILDENESPSILVPAIRYISSSSNGSTEEK